MRVTPIILAILISISIVPLNSLGYAKLNMRVEVPAIVGNGENFKCKIIFPKGYDMYYYNLVIFGYNLTNGGPTNTINGSSNSTNTFEVNITAPDYAPQTIGIYIEGKAKLGDKWAISQKTVHIKVVKSLKFTVTVECMDEFDASNITVYFYIDGKYIGNTTVNGLKSGQNATATFVWVPKDIDEGWHTLTAKIIGEGVVFSDTGNKTLSMEFYYGEYKPINWGPIIFAISAFISFLLIFLTIREIGKRRKPKWAK